MYGTTYIVMCFVSVKDLSLTFYPSERKRCSTITDFTSDIFMISLERSFDLDPRITLSPAEAVIIGMCILRSCKIIDGEAQMPVVALSSIFMYCVQGMKLV